ncbi:cell wall-binding repeat-containing protein [Clostridium scatologenes]|uniref:Putative cell wall binding repeat 2-containing protein n=1 Tax=Clostridium scatologenes TaxID=1548 RepID=A0A0E3M8A3_CLOSL|nr:cell wall-binding repeat-containing protein [Clostridium scatologenes]AKA69532.1 putative cell wall binding repeat 2-containing protein [Clostridium scatologenes]
MGKCIVLASGEGYADGLSASTLAKKLDAPILLTTSDMFSKDAENAISMLKPKNIYIVGGTEVISQNFEDQITLVYKIN